MEIVYGEDDTEEKIVFFTKFIGFWFTHKIDCVSTDSLCTLLLAHLVPYLWTGGVTWVLKAKSYVELPMIPS